MSPLRDNLKDRKKRQRGNAVYSIRVRVHVKLTDTCRGGRVAEGVEEGIVEGVGLGEIRRKERHNIALGSESRS